MFYIGSEIIDALLSKARQEQADKSQSETQRRPIARKKSFNCGSLLQTVLSLGLPVPFRLWFYNVASRELEEATEEQPD